MIKEEYFAYSKKGGVRLLFTGDYSDLEDIQRIRDFAIRMTVESVVDKYKNKLEKDK